MKSEWICVCVFCHCHADAIYIALRRKPHIKRMQTSVVWNISRACINQIRIKDDEATLRGVCFINVMHALCSMYMLLLSFILSYLFGRCNDNARRAAHSFSYTLAREEKRNISNVSFAAGLQASLHYTFFMRVSVASAMSQQWRQHKYTIYAVHRVNVGIAPDIMKNEDGNE